MFKRLLSTAVVFGTAALAPPAVSQTPTPSAAPEVQSQAASDVSCMSRDRLVHSLTQRYGEDLLGRGLQTPETLLEIWSSDSTGSFTIFVTNPSGQACIVATGENWIGYDLPLKGVSS
ncbi:hypothetical protein [Thalassovita mediterranea]|jgi:hypothetical protein|uniref:Uncharacterized protein n=1 Tax=Thalassovita mediterranea TaxID=340021 RepID=A0A0P1GS77_9RHOB|nr:hypothetical protein [Thalassovita mediterranea]MCG7572727.1 hypothetical protein [Phaeobacter sp. CNT1-3]CUH85441.1 hypothetical protein TM5383_02675 [Thalassovita mediterranea]SIS31686.1 hypothetical protein SAMN05421685_10525 [Thalassovita mediterranea]